jgi:hypothetical protein
MLYFIIKNHPFADGNKRTGSFLFLWYLQQNQHLLAKPVSEQINDTTLVASALLVAESLPDQKGDLDFNWIIVMAPNRIVDYVVIHELCHLKQLDHSPLFWKEVERVMPDYAECKEWLKNNAPKLTF